MAFVKLDCGMLDSSLWVDLEARILFITALLMAEPFEVVNPMPQFEVDSLKPTGFIVPPGWYGIVHSAGPGIVRRSMLDADAGMKALIRLGDPDPTSRTPLFEGRRLVRIDSGYLALNFTKYREKDHTAAERQRRYRENLKIRREAAQKEYSKRLSKSKHEGTIQGASKAVRDALKEASKR